MRLEGEKMVDKVVSPLDSGPDGGQKDLDAPESVTESLEKVPL